MYEYEYTDIYKHINNYLLKNNFNKYIIKYSNYLFIDCDLINEKIKISINNNDVLISLNDKNKLNKNIVKLKFKNNLKNIYIRDYDFNTNIMLKIQNKNNLNIKFSNKNYKNNDFSNLKINVFNSNNISFDLSKCNKKNIKFLLPFLNNLNIPKKIFIFRDNLNDDIINLKIFKKIKNIELKSISNINLNKLSNLEFLELYDCDIKELPNTLINLKELILYRCENIKEIPNTLINLQKLELGSCFNIKLLPYNLINLKKLIIKYFTLKILPNTLINLKYLELCHSKLKIIPNTLINLKTLKIREDFFDNFLNSNKYIAHINFFPNTLINLKKIYLENCFDIIKIPNTFINLKKLFIKNENDCQAKYNDEIFELNKKYCNLKQLYIYMKYPKEYPSGNGPYIEINLKDKQQIINFLNERDGNIFSDIYQYIIPYDM